jgi:hypothetical protein
VGVVDAVYACAPDGLGRDDTDPLEIPQSLLYRAQTVPINKSMDASPGQWRTGS